MTEQKTPLESPSEFSQLVRQFEQLPKERRLVAAYEFVRDIAYGNIGSRSAFDVLLAKKGTCSGKHALLKLLLQELGENVESWFAKHDFGKFPIRPWPSELTEFQHKNIPDYHDFLKVKDGDKWLTVDAVFDKPLSSLGFPTLEWDGKTSMQLPVDASEVFPAEGEMEDYKKKLIGALPEDAQKMRKEFLAAMTTWLDTKRNS